VGYLDGEGIGGSDGGSGGQGAGGTGGTGGTGGAGAATAFGHLGVAHLVEDGSYGQESLSLGGAFYGEDYDPEAAKWGYIDTLSTPDGVSCDIYYTSSMGGGGGPPDPPLQIDGGTVSAGADWDPDERLEILFDGVQYSVDWRNPQSSAENWPSWASPPQAVALTFDGTGGANALPFAQELILPAMPTLISPPADQQPVPPGEGGYLISWQPTEADELLVVLQFNLDWDDSAFRCHPPPGTTQLVIPGQWIVEWTWGSGAVQVIARNETTLMAGTAQVRLRAQRLRQRYVLFDVLWP